METLRESSMRTEQTGRPQSESATDSGPARTHEDGTGCDKGSEKIRNIPGPAAASAQSDRRARGESAGGNSQRWTLAQEHAQSARSGMAGEGDSSLGSRPAAGANRAEFVQQCLEDVDAAISRLFATLPDTDEIVLRVLDPTSGRSNRGGDGYASGGRCGLCRVRRDEAEIARPGFPAGELAVRVAGQLRMGRGLESIPPTDDCQISECLSFEQAHCIFHQYIFDF